MADYSASSRRDARAMEGRRLAALPLLAAGESLSAVARKLGVSRQAVLVWNRRRRLGEAGLLRRPRPGRPPKLARRQLAQLPRLLAQGAEVHGFSTPLWTTQRIADLIWRRFRVRYDRDHVCRLLHRFGWSWLKPARGCLDRSGVARPSNPCPTGAPRGPTPCLSHGCNGSKRWVRGAVTRPLLASRRGVGGTITNPSVGSFVRHRRRGRAGRSGRFWDGLNTHRSKKTRAARAELR